MTQLRQTLADWCMGDAREAPEYYRRVAEIGFVGIEMAEPEHWDAVRAAGLELVNICAEGMEWGLNRRDEHAAILPEIRASIDLAATNGIAQVVVFSGNRRGSTDSDGIANCVHGLEQVVGDAERAGVLLLFETLNSLADGHADYQADHSAFAFEVVRRVGSPALKVLYDIFHMHRMGEDVVQDIVEHVDLIGHLHIAGSRQRGFPGSDQEIHYPHIVQQVRSAGYDRLWGQEFLPVGDALEELAAAYELFAAAAGAARD